MDGPELPESTIELDPRHAVDLIIDTVMAHEPGTVTLVPTAGLTNIAMAARKEPRIVERVKEVVLMGGGYHVGNWSAVAEFNIIIDPEAAHIVFNEKWPVVMVGLDLTHQALATPEVVEQDRRTSDTGAGQVRPGTDGLLRRRPTRTPRASTTRPSTIPAPWRTSSTPASSRTRKVPVNIELQGTLTLGMTVADFRAPAPEDCHTSRGRGPGPRKVLGPCHRCAGPDRGSARPAQAVQNPPSAKTVADRRAQVNVHLHYSQNHDDDRGNVAALMVALLAACVAFQLNASMLSPALVTMGEELNADQAVIGLSQTWFFTAAALFSLFLPRLSDIVGRKKILVGMMVLMAVGSVIAALAPDVTWLFVGRIIQGVSGPTVPLCLIMLRSAVSNPRKYGTLMGLITAVNGGVAGVDSFVGGYFAEHFGFRSIFWLMVVLALVATVLIVVLAGESKPAAGTTMDWLGVFFIVVAVGALLTALNEGAKLVGGFDAGTLMLAWCLLVVAAVAFFAFWTVEKRAEQPMVETCTCASAATWAPLLTTTLTMTGIFAVINGIVPAYVQAAAPGFGVGPTEMSLIILTPYALLGWLCGPAQRPARTGPRLHQGAAHRPARQPRGAGHHRVLRPGQPAHDDCRHGACWASCTPVRSTSCSTDWALSSHRRQPRLPARHERRRLQPWCRPELPGAARRPGGDRRPR